MVMKGAARGNCDTKHKLEVDILYWNGAHIFMNLNENQIFQMLN